MKLSILSICLLILIQQSNAQNWTQDRFIVRVAHYNLPHLANAIDRCAGTVILARHVVTSASCVTPIFATRGVAVRRVADAVSSIFRVLKISIHPSYRTARNDHANIAVLFVDTEFATENLPLFPLVPLPTNASCNLFGWGQQALNPRRDPVMIFGSDYCDPNSPQVSCSTFDSLSHGTCSAELGSPVFCGDGLRFSGFVTNDGCKDDGTRIVLKYHSVSPYREWFEEVVRSDSVQREVSTNFVGSVMEFNSDNINTARVRCVGTIITERHLLTTASCVFLPDGSNQAIGIQGSWEGLGWSTIRPDEITIHPSYVTGQLRSYNVAVIRSGIRFTRANPRTLGALPSSNSTDSHFCQVIGWGGSQGASRHDVVGVYSPQFCYNNLPQVFCSTIDWGSNRTCTALQGSPVICGEGSHVSGFLLNNRGCGAIGTVNSLDYHSVGEFREWIEKVTDAGSVVKSSMLFILSAILISAKNFL